MSLITYEIAAATDLLASAADPEGPLVKGKLLKGGILLGGRLVPLLLLLLQGHT